MLNQTGIYIVRKTKYDDTIFFDKPRITKPHPRVSVIIVNFSGIKRRCICTKLVNNYNIFKNDNPRSTN